MKLLSILLIAATIGLSSCSSAYRTEQTPDDVYYSPGKPSGYASSGSSNNNSDEYYNANPNDQYLMMKAQDPSRWSAFDDYGYDGFYSPYNSFGYGFGYYNAFSPWSSFGYWNPYYAYMNSYYMWNSFYNPYYGGVVVVAGGKYSSYNTFTGLHPFNLNTYKNTYINNTNSRYYSPNTIIRNPNSTNSGNAFRRPFSNQGSNNFNNNNRSFSQPTRTFTPSSSFGSSGGSRGGGGGFSRPGRP